MKIKKVKVNNKKKQLEIETSKGAMSLPFAKLKLKPIATNKIKKIYVDRELGNEAITYELEKGDEASVHVDAFLDFNRDKDYLVEQQLHKLSVAAHKAFEESSMTKAQVVKALDTSPSQLDRLLDSTNYKKSIKSMIHLLAVLDKEVEIRIKAA